MKKANIIVLAGQSNAVGVGHFSCLPKHFSPERIQKWCDGYDNILINYFSHDKKSDGFVKTTVGCTEVSKKTIGPELGIAEALDQRYPGQEFFIVKCAFGGMTLFRDFLSPSGGKEYDPLSYADQKENIICNYNTGEPVRAGWCYNELVKILWESIAALQANGYEPAIRAFCWMQGESDTATEEIMDGYVRRYDAMLRDFKAEFCKYLDRCVYIDAGISETWGGHYRLNALKKEYADRRADCVYIDTIAAGLTVGNEPDGEPDIAHYDSDSVIRLGHLFAEEIKI